MPGRTRRTAAGSPFSRLLRTTGLIVVFLCAGLLFWKHFDGYRARGRWPQALSDWMQLLWRSLAEVQADGWAERQGGRPFRVGPDIQGKQA